MKWSWLDKSYVRYILWALFLFNVYWTMKVLPDAAAEIKKEVGREAEVLDVRPGYSPEEAYEFIDTVGLIGRQKIRDIYFYEDLIYPLAYGFLFALASAWFLRKSFPRIPSMMWLVLFPLATIVIDFGENMMMVRMIDAFPDKAEATANVAGKLTTLKWGFVLVSLVVVFGSMLAYFLKKYVFRNLPSKEEK